MNRKLLMVSLTAVLFLLLISGGYISDAAENDVPVAEDTSGDSVSEKALFYDAMNSRGKVYKTTGTVTKIDNKLIVTEIQWWENVHFLTVPAVLYEDTTDPEIKYSYKPTEGKTGYEVVLGDGVNPVTIKPDTYKNIRIEPGLTIAEHALDNHERKYNLAIENPPHDGKLANPDLQLSTAPIEVKDSSGNIIYDENGESIKIQSNLIPLSWNKISDTTKYQLKCKLLNNGDWPKNEVIEISYQEKVGRSYVTKSTELRELDSSSILVLDVDQTMVDPNHAIMVKAIPCVLSYDYISALNGEEHPIVNSSLPSKEVVLCNDVFKAPSISGYSFVKANDSEGNIVADGSKVTKNMALSLYYEPIKYELKLIDGQSESVKKYTVEDTVVLEPIQKEGNFFGGWFEDMNYSTLIEEIKESIGNKTVYAKWYPCNIGGTVGVGYNFGSHFEVNYVKVGSTVPSHKVLERYGFDTTWFVHDTHEEVVAGTTIINKSLQLDPVYTLKEYRNVLLGKFDQTGTMGLAYYDLNTDGSAVYICDERQDISTTVPSYIVPMKNKLNCVYGGEKPECPCWTVVKMGNGSPVNIVVLNIPLTVKSLDSTSYSDCKVNELRVNGKVNSLTIDRTSEGSLDCYIVPIDFNSGIFKFKVETIKTGFDYGLKFDNNIIQSVNGIYAIDVTTGNHVISAFKNCEEHVEQSHFLPSIIDTDTPIIDQDGTVNSIYSWNFGGLITKDGEQWVGQASIPLIVGEYAYIRAADMFCKVDLETGLPVKSVQSRALPSFYHTVTYLGNGYVQDAITGKVYDEDLNYVCNLDGRLFYNEDDGFAYSIGSSLKKFSTLDIDKYINEEGTLEPVWTLPETNKMYGQFGTSSTPLFFKDSLYYIFTKNNEPGNNECKYQDICIQQIYNIHADDIQDMIISEINLNVENGLPISNTDGSKGQYMIDDGFLTTDGRNTLYITGYTKNLWGMEQGNQNGGRIVSIKLNSDNTISDCTVSFKDTTDTWIHSAFLTYGNFGFINVGGVFQVYNMNPDGTIGDLLTEQVNQMTHGSIVMNIVNSSKGIVTFYLVPYNGVDVDVRLYTFDLNKKILTSAAICNDTPNDYCSQNIRSSSEGRMVWYNDSGKVYCNSASDKNVYYIFIQEGNNGKWIKCSGSTVVEAFTNTNLISFSGNTVLGIKYDGSSDFSSNFNIFGIEYDMENLNRSDFVNIENKTLTPSKYNLIHCYVITDQNAPPALQSKWIYEQDGVKHTYKFDWDLKGREFVGVLMTLDNSVQHSILKSSVSNGSFSISEPTASAGELITITTSPNRGYEVDTVECISNEQNISVEGSNNSFSFIMPSTDVMIIVTFKEITEEISPTLEYKLDYEKSTSGSNTVLDISVKRTTGTTDLADARFLVIAEYDGGIVVNVYSKVDLNNGCSNEQVFVSTAGLKSITVELVDGIPNAPSFDYYGCCIFNATS